MRVKDIVYGCVIGIALATTIHPNTLAQGQVFWGQSGRYNNPEKQKAEMPPNGSLNHLFHLTRQPVSFLDLTTVKGQKLWITHPLVARLDGSIRFEANWTNVFDDILFIDIMQASIPGEK